jgi:MraZ protein
MSTFYGTERFAIDAKSRISIPAHMRRAADGKLTREFIILAHFEGCLALFTQEQFKDVEEKFKRIAFGNPKGRAFSRAYLKDAKRVSVDAQGRITIPPALMGRAGLGREAILLGQVDRIEVWNPERFEDATRDPLANIEQLGQELLGES